jgi:hypothetical protein
MRKIVLAAAIAGAALSLAACSEGTEEATDAAMADAEANVEAAGEAVDEAAAEAGEAIDAAGEAVDEAAADVEADVQDQTEEEAAAD